MKQSPRVRISDIAKELGLSTATVSNVIHGKTKKMSAETVRRVQELLEKRQYIPSMAGILLAQNDSRIIGVIVNDHPKYEGHTLEDSFIAASLNALAGELEREGYFLMLRLAKQIGEVPRFASMWNMEGLILMGFCEEDYESLKGRMHIPLIVYDGFGKEADSFANIETDHYAGGVLAGEYLKEKGHERVFCISDNAVCMDLLRFEGLKSVLPKARLMLVPYETEKRHFFYGERLQELLRYTAAFAVSDYYAIDFMQFLLKNGIAVPKRMSVVGFDDTREAAHVSPALTTVRQEHWLRAKTALKLLAVLRGGEGERESVKLPVSLVERDSVVSPDSPG